MLGGVAYHHIKWATKTEGSEYPTADSTLDKASFSALPERKRKQRVPGYCPVIE